MHVYTNARCVHYDIQTHYGYGQLRGRAHRTFVDETRLEMFQSGNLHAKPTTMFERRLHGVPASGNRQ